ncbi:MAG: acyl-CoA dehydrogenase [Hoeflea sp. BRH_c9]|nr:MAG: acyl-CoA dehydrogenase [Hoeflea sp. BRH_c9]
MIFELTDQQRLVKDSVDRLMSDRYTFEARETIRKGTENWSRERWKDYAGLGLLALRVDEADGGFGCGPFDTMIVMEAFGRALALEPYVSTVLLGAGLIRLAANAEQRARLLPPLCEGRLLLAFAHSEEQSGNDLRHVAATAAPAEGGFVLNGKKTLVLHGDSADYLIVSARSSGATLDPSGIGLFLVAAEASGLSRRSYRMIDGQRAADIELNGVRVSPDNVIDASGQSLPIIQQVVEETIAALAAEAVGVMDEMLRLTSDYLRVRKQFGVEIASFQAIQHRLADMFIALEQARSMAMFAANACQSDDASHRSTCIAAAKVQISRSIRFVSQQAIQLHGGIGMTMEYKIGHLFQRATMIDTLFGNGDHHLSRLAAGSGLFAALDGCASDSR